MPVPFDYQTDWTRIARLIVHDSLRLERGERVLIHTDPTYFPALTETVRVEVNRAGGRRTAWCGTTWPRRARPGDRSWSTA